jgi:hypothetical protein
VKDNVLDFQKCLQSEQRFSEVMDRQTRKEVFIVRDHKNIFFQISRIYTIFPKKLMELISNNVHTGNDLLSGEESKFLVFKLFNPKNSRVLAAPSWK